MTSVKASPKPKKELTLMQRTIESDKPAGLRRKKVKGKVERRSQAVAADIDAVIAKVATLLMQGFV